MMEGNEPVTLINLLDRLLEPAEPLPVSMMPQTWGWLVIAAVMAIILGYIAWRRWLVYQAGAYRREALTDLRNAAGDAKLVATIIRRTALTAYPRSETASLSGPDWLQFLDDKTGGNEFSSSPGFASVPYTNTPEFAADNYTAIAEHWIKKHVPEPG